MKTENNPLIEKLYQSPSGRLLLKAILASNVLTLAEKFVKSPLSKGLIPKYISKNKIDMQSYGKQNYHSFAQFFSRRKLKTSFDTSPLHLISPCDGWLSFYKISDNCLFSIKNSHYRVIDLVSDQKIAEKFKNGTCLVFRLEATDYHRYCYIDDCFQYSSHYLEGKLHSVQPIALEKYPIFRLNRRVWNLLKTKHFGEVVQTEIGAMLVGGIENHHQKGHFIKGEEMGTFTLHGSTITLLFQENMINLKSEILKKLNKNYEIKVNQGMWIGNGKK